MLIRRLIVNRNRFPLMTTVVSRTMRSPSTVQLRNFKQLLRRPLARLLHLDQSQQIIFRRRRAGEDGFPDNRQLPQRIENLAGKLVLMSTKRKFPNHLLSKAKREINSKQQAKEGVELRALRIPDSAALYLFFAGAAAN